MKESISGFENELEIKNKIDNKKIRNLEIMFQLFIKDLYGHNIDENSYVKAQVNYSSRKYDIILSINNIIKRISIKKGIKNSVHVEAISSFIHFLIDNGVEKKYIHEYLKYHYADGTSNGTGKTRISVSEYKEKNQDSIDELNKRLNNKTLLEKAIERFIIKGNISDTSIDALLYGTKNSFIWLKKEDIRKLILLKKDVYSSGIHFGPLSVQPLTRCLNYNPKYEKRRFCVQVKWYNIYDDIVEYFNNLYMSIIENIEL